MNRTSAIPYIGYCLDNTLAVRSLDDMPDNAVLVGWQAGFEPMFVAVWSYLGGDLDEDEAIEIAKDFLDEIKWFAGPPTEPDWVL